MPKQGSYFCQWYRAQLRSSEEKLHGDVSVVRRAECRRDRGSGGRADLAHGPRCLPRNLTFCRECVCQRCDRRSVAQQAKRVCGVGCDGGVTIVQQGAQPRGARTPSLYPNLAYKPDVDFEPIGVVIEVPIVVVAKKNFPANDLKEFMAYVRANAAKLNMAHAGVGSNVFNFGLLLNSLLGVRPTLVPFTGQVRPRMRC